MIILCLHVFFSASDRKNQLEWQCQSAKTPVKCSDNSSFCIYDWKECDGVANCPGAEDELLSKCIERRKFSSLATVNCTKKDTYNVDIFIKAVKCDGIKECQNDEDEKECSLPDYLLIVILIIIVILNGFMAYLLKKWTISKLEPILQNQDFELIHGVEEIASKLKQVQSDTDISRQINEEFIEMEIAYHYGSCSETILCIKVSYFLLAIFSYNY